MAVAQGLEGSFNSRMVRLKYNIDKMILESNNSFNSRMVRLKFVYYNPMFKLYYVSIPEWCD